MARYAISIVETVSDGLSPVQYWAELMDREGTYIERPGVVGTVERRSHIRYSYPEAYAEAEQLHRDALAWPFYQGQEIEFTPRPPTEDELNAMPHGEY